MRLKTSQPIQQVARDLVAVMIAEDLTQLRDVRDRDDWNAYSGNGATAASVGNISIVSLVNTANVPLKLGVVDRITVSVNTNYGLAIVPAVGGSVQTWSLDPRIGGQVGTPFLIETSTPAAAPAQVAVIPSAVAYLELPHGIVIPTGFMLQVFPIVVNTGITVNFFFRQLALQGN